MKTLKRWSILLNSSFPERSILCRSSIAVVRPTLFHIMSMAMACRSELFALPTTNAAAAGAICPKSPLTVPCAIAAKRYWGRDEQHPFPTPAFRHDLCRDRLHPRPGDQMGDHRPAVARTQGTDRGRVLLQPDLGRKLRHFAVDVRQLHRHDALDARRGDGACRRRGRRLDDARTGE